MSYNQYNRSDASSRAPLTLTLSLFMSRVYAWMTAGIAVTGCVAYGVGSSPDLVAQIVANQVFFWGVIILQFAAVIYLTMAINRISQATAAITFLMYSALTGLTMSLIFAIYTQQSIAVAFAATAASFGGLSIYGYTTRRDLGPIGSFCLMGLFGLIAIMILSIFIPSLRGDSMQLTISALGVLIFAGLTAYDTQRIKAMSTDGDARMNQKAIYGALVLYLDFINLFMNLLRLMGDRK